MSTKNRQNTKNIIIFISVLMILVVFFIFMGFTDYSEGRIPVIATAVEVRYHDETKWYAKYTVNGKSYKSCVHGAYIGLSNGRIITVYYDPDDPSEIWHNPDKGIAKKANKQKREFINRGEYNNPYDYNNINNNSNNPTYYNPYNYNNDDINKF